MITRKTVEELYMEIEASAERDRETKLRLKRKCPSCTGPMKLIEIKSVAVLTIEHHECESCGAKHTFVEGAESV